MGDLHQMSGRGKGPVTSSRDEGTATSSVPAGSGSHADAVAQGMTVEDLQKELDRLKAYLKKVEAELTDFVQTTPSCGESGVGKDRREKMSRRSTTMPSKSGTPKTVPSRFLCC